FSAWLPCAFPFIRQALPKPSMKRVSIESHRTDMSISLNVVEGASRPLEHKGCPVFRRHTPADRNTLGVGERICRIGEPARGIEAQNELSRPRVVDRP